MIFFFTTQEYKCVEKTFVTSRWVCQHCTLSICCINPYDLNKKQNKVSSFNLPSVFQMMHRGSNKGMIACCFMSWSMSGGSNIFPIWCSIWFEYKLAGNIFRLSPFKQKAHRLSTKPVNLCVKLYHHFLKPLNCAFWKGVLHLSRPAVCFRQPVQFQSKLTFFPDAREVIMTLWPLPTKILSVHLWVKKWQMVQIWRNSPKAELRYHVREAHVTLTFDLQIYPVNS